MNYNFENHGDEYGELMKMSTIFLIVLRTKKELAPVIVEEGHLKSSALKQKPSFQG